MRLFWKISPFWNADGAGGGGDPGAGGGTPAAPASSGQPAPPGAGDGSAPAAAGQAAQPAAGAAPADYWPEGLDASLKGTDPKSTLDNFHKKLTEADKALKGYREVDSKRDVVKTVEEMLDFSKSPDFKIEERNKPFFDALATDPLFKTVAEAAIKDGIGRRAVGNLYQNFLNAASEAGLLEPMLDVKAERSALLPDVAKSLDPKSQDAAIDKRMQENYDFLSLASKNMGLSEDAAKYVELMVGDSAKGHQFFEWVRGLAQNANAGPGNHGGSTPAGGATSREALRAEMAELDKQSHLPGYAEKARALDEKYKQLFPG